MGKGLFDLEKHYAFYGAYHSNPINIIIHMIFVWPIVFASLLMLYYAPPLFRLPIGTDGFVVGVGLVSTSIYAIFYIIMDPKAGSLAAALCFLCWYGAGLLGASLGYSLGWKVSLAAQLFCWIGQFLGHGIFEGRAPALLDNLVQAFLMAPFFVLLEGLEKYVGYEPYPGFRASVHAKVDVARKEWEASKLKKSS